MEKVKSYLSVELESESCFLCGDLIKKKDKITVFKDEGWLSLREQAERWPKIKISIDDSLFSFTNVYPKIAGATEAFGKAHTSCRTTFRTRAEAHGKQYGCISESESPVDEACISATPTTATRSISAALSVSIFWKRLHASFVTRKGL